MGSGEAHFVAIALGVVSIGVVAYELVRWTGVEITLEKLVAAGVWLAYLLVGIAVDGAAGLIVGLFMFVPLGLIWLGDELGSVTGIKALVARQSPGLLVRLVGWLGLIGPAAWAICGAIVNQ